MGFTARGWRLLASATPRGYNILSSAQMRPILPCPSMAQALVIWSSDRIFACLAWTLTYLGNFLHVLLHNPRHRPELSSVRVLRQ